VRFSGPGDRTSPNPKKSIVVIAHVRTIQTNDFRRRTGSTVSHPNTAPTGSADQFEHCPNSGCPCDPTPSRNQTVHIGHFAVGLDPELGQRCPDVGNAGVPNNARSILARLLFGRDQGDTATILLCRSAAVVIRKQP